MSVDITYIVSAYDRPQSLKSCLASLNNQTNDDYQLIVTDNTTDECMSSIHEEICRNFNAFYLNTRQPTCYHSAEIGAKFAWGTWLAFPSDDSYYVPTFAETML